MKRSGMVFLITLFLALPMNIASAQSAAPNLFDTITVVGTGSASGSPDIANIDIGVETLNQDVGEAFSQTNTTLEVVINAMTEAGVAREDIRTTGLNIHSQQPPLESDQPVEYRVTNQVHVIVRDLSSVEQLINAAVDAGANHIFGLNLGIDDRTTLENEARAAAVENAQQKAEQTAALLGVEVGEVLIVSEVQGNAAPLGGQNFAANTGGAVIETSQLTVQVQMSLTYRIVR